MDKILQRDIELLALVVELRRVGIKLNENSAKEIAAKYLEEIKRVES